MKLTNFKIYIKIEKRQNKEKADINKKADENKKRKMIKD